MYTHTHTRIRKYVMVGANQNHRVIFSQEFDSRQTFELMSIKVMRTFGWSPTEEELKDLVNVIDVDGNGDISFNEFVWLMTK